MNAIVKNKKEVVNNEVTTKDVQIVNAILTPTIDLLSVAKEETKKQQLSKVERINNLIPKLNLVRLRRLKAIVKTSLLIDKKVILESINKQINELNKKKLQNKFDKEASKVQTEKSIISFEDKSEFFTIINVLKALKLSDSKRSTPIYGVIKAKAFKTSSLNLFLTESQFSDVLIKKGLYNFDSVKNAVIKLSKLTKAQQICVYSYADEINELINNNDSFVEKLIKFEALQNKLGI